MDRHGPQAAPERVTPLITRNQNLRPQESALAPSSSPRNVHPLFETKPSDTSFEDLAFLSAKMFKVGLRFLGPTQVQRKVVFLGPERGAVPENHRKRERRAKQKEMALEEPVSSPFQTLERPKPNFGEANCRLVFSIFLPSFEEECLKAPLCGSSLWAK